jgi:hypothetical protein
MRNPVSLRPLASSLIRDAVDDNFTTLKNPQRRFEANPASDFNANADSYTSGQPHYDGLTVGFEMNFVYPEFRRRI